MTFAPGTRFDRYEIVRAVASGGMGTVWLAQQTGKHGFEKRVAVKTIRPDLATSGAARTMFLDEARIAARVEHAHVAQVLDVGELDGNVYLVLEWIDGTSLEKLCVSYEAANEPPPLGELLRIVADACEGLAVAHDLRDPGGAVVGLVHRDISPQNILVARTGSAKIIDFGIAKAKNRISGETESGIVRGKRAYMAPEQARAQPVDRRADIWAMGAVLYRALVGYPPLDEDASVLPVPADVAAPVRLILERALAIDPAARYQSATELAAAIEAAMVELGARAASTDVATRFRTVLETATNDAPPLALPPTVPLERTRSTPTVRAKPRTGDRHPESASDDARSRVAAPAQRDSVVAMPRSRSLVAALALAAGLTLVLAIVLVRRDRDRDRLAGSGSAAPIAVDAATATATAPPDADARDLPIVADAAVAAGSANPPVRVQQPAKPQPLKPDDAVSYRHQGKWVDANVLYKQGTSQYDIRIVGGPSVSANTDQLRPRKRLPALPIGARVRMTEGTATDLTCTVKAIIQTEEYTLTCGPATIHAKRSSLVAADG